MAFDWRELQRLAEHLTVADVPNITREALLRSAVSRAYYGAYGLARRFAVERLEFVPHEQGEDHFRLRRRFLSRGYPRIAVNLQVFRDWRNDCDYADAVPGIESIARQALEYAREIADALTSARGDDP